MDAALRNRRTVLVGTAALLAVLAGAATQSTACPFCPTITSTLSEQLAQNDAAVLVQWVDGTKPSKASAGSTLYEVVQIAKNPSKHPVEKGARVRLDVYRAGKKGDLSLLFGVTGEKGIEWLAPAIEITETGFQYLVQAPSPEEPAEKRLTYFLKFLEFPDKVVSDDAFGEFAMAPYKDLVPLTKSLPRERLRKWIAAGTEPARLGLYGLMLGLCGDATDATWMEKKITEPTEEIRIGIDGIMAGYLLIEGEKGLDLLDQTKLKKSANAPFSEMFAALNALRFIGQYTDGKIPKDRLKASMRLMLEQPAVADLVIIDLARWKDWSVQDRLLTLFDDEEYKGAVIRRNIVRYMMASIKDAPKDPSAPIPEHVTKGKEILEKLRTRDKKAVEDAERFAFGS